MYRLRRLCLLAGLFLSLPAVASANPRLAGLWVANAAPDATLTFNFSPGYCLGSGIWRGPCVYDISGFVMPRMYELRMFNGVEGTVTLLSSQYDIGYTVGTVNFANQTLNYKNVNYTHRPGVVPLVVPVPGPFAGEGAGVGPVLPPPAACK
jgi:hypothetical protein